MKKRLGWSLLAGIAISVISLYFAFKNVPFNQLIKILASFRYGWVLPSVAAVCVSMVIRVLRWQMILGTDRRVKFWAAFHPLVIGFFINCILPGRVGEVARPLILKQNSHVPFSEGLATVVVERFFDMVILIGLLLGTLAWVKIDPNIDIPVGAYHLNRETLVHLASGMSLMGVALLIGFFLLMWNATRCIILRIIISWPQFLFQWWPTLSTLIADRFSLPLAAAIKRFSAGLTSLQRPLRLAGCLGLSLLLWLIIVFSYHVLVRGIPGLSLSFIETTVMMVIVCFFIALPSVPGYWGLWEAAGIFGLSLFGIPGDQASAYTLVSHVVQLFPVILIGAGSMIITGVQIRNVISEGGGQSSQRQLEGGSHG
jgi:glycosyltransferase 2 family protein